MMKSKEFLKTKYGTFESHQFIDYIFNNAEFDYSELPQNLITIHDKIGINDPSGTSLKISNIKLNLFDLLKAVFLISNQIESGSPLGLMLIFVDCVSTLYNKAKKVLNPEDCMVLLSIKEIGQNSINEDFLKNHVMQKYNISSLKYQRAISNLSHIRCIKIKNGSVELAEKICVKYDY